MSNNLDEIKRHVFPQIKNIVNNIEPDAKKAEKMIGSLYATVIRLSSDPKIMGCTPSSVATAFAQAIDLGLKLDPIYGECTFIVYGKNTNIGNGKWEKVDTLILQPQAKGLANLARREGGWEIQVFIVYKCDKFEMKNVFTGQWMEKRITVFEENEAEREAHEHDSEWCFNNLRYVVASARRDKNEQGKPEIQQVILTRNMVETRRLMSNAQKVGKYTPEAEKKRLAEGLPIGIWEEHYPAMSVKTGLAAISRLVPKSKAFEKLTNLLDSQDAIDSTSTTVTEPDKKEPLALTQIPTNSVDFSIDTETGELLDADVPNYKSEQPLQQAASIDEIPDIDYWTVAVSDSATNAELTELLAEMPDNVKLELEHVIDAKFDSFAKPEESEKATSKAEPAPLDKYTDLRTALSECDSVGAFAILHNGMDAKTKSALAEEIKATNNRIKSAQATAAA